MPYIPTTEKQKQEMLKVIGVNSIEELFSDIPEAIHFKGELNIPKGVSEREVLLMLSRLSEKNISTKDYACFLGAGAYDHLIPEVVGALITRGEFLTAYTPYQAEISQGVLQSIFEYQSFICLLTGFDVANASLYDGASGVAEACIMAASHTNKSKIIISKSVNPAYIQVSSTYLKNQNVEIVSAPIKDGQTDYEALYDLIDENTAAVVIQHPNFFGYLEEMTQIGIRCREKKVMFISIVNPISLGILQPPVSYGADIAVGEGQALGTSLSFGGPYLGFIAANNKLVRKMPGRIVGQTTDHEGNRGFVLTLQAREQHIRREKATSNICSNEALNALTAGIYLATLGKWGLRRVAEQCLQKAHYTKEKLNSMPGWELLWDKPFFNEFPMYVPMDVHELNRELLEYKIIGGFPLEKWDKSMKNGVLMCITEARTREEIDRLCSAVSQISQKLSNSSNQQKKSGGIENE
jgi:glycine dehydrogenase subunit 1